MIEIIIEEVKMPPLSERKYHYVAIGYGRKWLVVDSHNGNLPRYKGGYQDAAIACHNLNKKYYKENPIEAGLAIDKTTIK